jgi:2-furoate---CoA ligase
LRHETRTRLAVVERSPDALAIVDGERRLSYAAWYREIGRVRGGLAALGLSRRDRLAVILQNRLEMATLHWTSSVRGAGAARNAQNRMSCNQHQAS